MRKYARNTDVHSWMDISQQDLDQPPMPYAASGANEASPSPADEDAVASGLGNVTVVVVASGDQTIDGLLRGRRWSGTITYTDPDNADDYQAGYFYDGNNNATSAQNEGFSQISASQMLAVQYALDKLGSSGGETGFSVEAFTGLGISYGGSGLGTGNIRVANTSDNSTGLAFYPADTDYGGDAWMGTSIQGPVQGNYAWNNTLHELGHTLGLKHGQTADGVASLALPTEFDSLEYTVMTYRSYVGAATDFYKNGAWDYPQTYMMLDVQALQYMYGADFKTNAGKTVYKWDPTSGNTLVNGEVGIEPGGTKIFATIWDGGGAHDTYDLSKYTDGVEIDLRPGQASTFSASQLADLGFSQGAGQHMAGGNIFNALLYHKDKRSLIEDAIGGKGADTITGNQGQNWLKGGLGDDTLTGAAARDVFYFRTGWDIDTITDFDTKGKDHDVLNLSGWSAVKNFDDLRKHHVSMHQGDVWISASGGDRVILEDTTIKELHKADFQF